MSADNRNEEILEHNVEQLLTRAHEPPRMALEARRRVLQAISERHQPDAADVVPIAAGSRRSWAIAALAAVAALLLVAWGASALRGGVDADAGGTAPPIAQFENTAATPKVVSLADGSQAILRAGTAIAQLAAREIRLDRGELVLDVVKGEEPFVVHTEHGRAVALGTRFSVRSEAASVLTSVIRGKVRIESGAGAAVLDAGEHGRLDSTSPPATNPAPRLSHTLLWAKESLSGLVDRDAEPLRRGNLVARQPRSGAEWPLPMRELVVDVHVEDGVARTTIDQTFFNHVAWQLEGVYSFPLPTDAAISRLAMYVDGKLMEGGIVERQRGRNVYENIVYQRRDPALLEWMKGNEFRVRIFPLPPRTEKRIILSYTQPLTDNYGAYGLSVPIPEIDLPVANVEYRVHVEGADYQITSDSHRLRPVGDNGAVYVATAQEIGTDFAVTLKPRTPEPHRTVTYEDDSGHYLMARVRPEVVGGAGHEARSWVVLYDTSGSRDTRELEAQAWLTRRLVHEMDEDDRVAFVAYDTEARRFGGFSRVAEVDGEDLGRQLASESTRAAGVTNLAGALDEAVAMLGAESQAPHILVLGDGAATEGTTALEALRGRVAGLATVVAIAIGDGTDTRTFDALARATGGVSVVAQPGEDLGWRAFETISALSSPRLQNVAAVLLDEHGSEIADVEPLLSAVQLEHGQGVSVLAHGDALAGGRVHAVRLEATLDGEAWSETFDLFAESRPAAYLPRLWAQRQIDAWIDQDAEAHREPMTALAMKHFLISPFTSLLVLESEAMAKEFSVALPKGPSWARYPAPETIAVEYEPMGTDPGGVASRSADRLLRDPLAIFGGSHAWPTTSSAGGMYTGPVRGFGWADERRSTGARLAFPLQLGDVADITIDRTTVDIDAPMGATVTATLRSATAQRESGYRWARAASIQGQGRGGADVGRSLRRRRFSKRVNGEWAEGLSHNMWDGRGYYNPGVPTVPYAVALHYATDQRLDDVTNFVPGMLADDGDYARERLLLAAAPGAGGSMSDEARALVSSARAALLAGRYSSEDGMTLSIDTKGRFAMTRVTRESLAEEVLYDGEYAYALYDELGLAVRRSIGPTSPLLLFSAVPWVMPEADHLARWYDVTVSGPRTLRLAPPKEGAPQGDAVEIVLDDAGRIVAVTRNGHTTQIEHDTRGITLRGVDRTTRLERVDGGGLLPPVDEGEWTLVELPLRTEAHWAEQVGEATSGTAQWRHMQRQRLATAAATGQGAALAATTRALLDDAVDLTAGELALCSGAVAWLSASDIDRMTAEPTVAPALRAYLLATRALRDGKGAGALNRAADEYPTGLLGTLLAYRGALASVERRRAKGDRAAVEAFIKAHGRSELAFVLVQRAAQMLPWQRGEGATLWASLAKHDAWRPVAEYSAGLVLNRAGKASEASEAFVRSFEAALALDEMPIVDWSLRQTIVSAKGEASFRLLWSRWRGVATSTRDTRRRAAFVAMAGQLGLTDDVHRVVTSTRKEDLRNVSAGIDLIEQLLGVAQHDDAWLLTRRMLEADSPDAAVLDLAATISEKQGRIADAAGYLERAMASDTSTTLTLQDVRADYRRLLGLHASLAQSQLDSEIAAEHRERALEAAMTWRQDDPDNAEIDRLCASLFVDDPAEAWRYLSGPIERHPAEGSAYAEVAQQLEREGQQVRADRVWQDAMRVEPTNPTWALRRAESLAAAGRESDAITTLTAIVDGEWQDRFAPIQTAAERLKTQLEG
ncbi:MAG: VIT domain-containing protein [Myxococcota bacterium]